MTEANNTNAATATAKVGRPKTTILKQDLTVEFAASKLEVREVAVEGQTNEDGSPKTQKFLFWKVDGPIAKAGDFAGSVRPVDNYYSVVLAGVNYSGKQLIAFLETGTWVSQRAVAATKEKAVKEAGPKQPRVFALPTQAEKDEAKAKAKARMEARKAAEAAKKAAEAPAEQPAGEAVEGAETADIDADSATL